MANIEIPNSRLFSPLSLRAHRAGGKVVRAEAPQGRSLTRPSFLSPFFFLKFSFFFLAVCEHSFSGFRLSRNGKKAVKGSEEEGAL
jgi:hypothetical protein